MRKFQGILYLTKSEEEPEHFLDTGGETALGLTNSVEFGDGWWQHHSSEKGHTKRC